MTTYTPDFLKPGQTIGVCAPSFGCTIEPYISRFNEAKRIFNSLGYKINAGSTVFKSDGLGISTDPKTCGKELTDFYTGEENDMIISAGGGELMCESISYVDFDRIKNSKPKWFCGYSDNTNFIFPLVTRCNVKAIYSHNISGFGKKWEESETYTYNLLTGKQFSFDGFNMFQSSEDGTEAKNADPLSPYILTQKKELVYGNKKRHCKMEGVFLGGCLDVLNNLCGTKQFDYTVNFIKERDSKIIWALEACDANVCEIRRNLWHLKESGWFDSAAGFIFGRPLAAWNQSVMGINQYNAVTDILSSLNVPILMNADFGHLAPTVPVVMGSYGTVTAEDNYLNISFEDLKN